MLSRLWAFLGLGGLARLMGFLREAGASRDSVKGSWLNLLTSSLA